MTLTLLTSNKNKIAEFQRFGLPVEAKKGKDIKEVLGTAQEVITYKTLEVESGCIVEDTILTINGEDVVDIRYRLDNINKYAGMPAVWRVSLGVVIDGNLHISHGEIEGSMTIPKKDDNAGFGFDPYFIPSKNNPNNHSLSMLESLGTKDEYSARKKAVLSLINGKCTITPTQTIPKWSGGYQDE